MRGMTTIVGVILILLGIAGFAYQGYTYNTPEKVAEIGGLKLTADTEKVVYVPPILSGGCIVAGLLLVVVGRMRK